VHSTVVSDAVKKALQKVVVLQQKVSDTAAKRAAKEKREERHSQDQDRIRSNMDRLSQSSDLYKRYVKTLTDEEDELAKLREDIAGLRDTEAAQRRDLEPVHTVHRGNLSSVAQPRRPKRFPLRGRAPGYALPAAGGFSARAAPRFAEKLGEQGNRTPGKACAAIVACYGMSDRHSLSPGTRERDTAFALSSRGWHPLPTLKGNGENSTCQSHP